MSLWLHNLCRDCYAELEPGRVPHHLVEAPLTICCLCGDENADSIPYRADPRAFKYCGLSHGRGDHAA